MPPGKEKRCPDFSLIAVSHLQWDHDMASKAVSGLSDPPGADDYFQLHVEKILPANGSALATREALDVPPRVGRVG